MKTFTPLAKRPARARNIDAVAASVCPDQSVGSGGHESAHLSTDGESSVLVERVIQFGPQQRQRLKCGPHHRHSYCGYREHHSPLRAHACSPSISGGSNFHRATQWPASTPASKSPSFRITNRIPLSLISNALRALVPNSRRATFQPYFMTVTT